MKKHAFITLAAFLLMFTVNSCKKETTQNPSCAGGTFLATINGTAFTGKTYQNTLIRSVSGGYAAKRLDIRATAADGKVLILTVNNIKDAASGKCVRAIAYYNDLLENYSGASGFEAIIGTYMTDANTVEAQTSPSFGDGKGDGHITISSCNEADLKVSGSFDFKADTYTIKGTFTNMCYTFSE